MKLIACVEAREFPEGVDDYCVDNDIEIHYQNDIAVIKDDGNPFAEWLKKQGYEFTDKDGDYVAVIAT